MAAGAMASFISRVSSFLLAAATLSATNQPLNNQHHHHHHQLQQHHQYHHSNHQQHHHQNHPIKFQPQQHQDPIKAHHLNHHHLLPPAAFLLNQQQHHQQQQQHQRQALPSPQHLTNRQATVSFGDLASSSTSRASNTLPGAGVTFTGTTNFVNSPPPPPAASSSSSSSSIAPAQTSSPPPAAPATLPQATSSASSSLSSPGQTASPVAAATAAAYSPLASSMFDVFEYVMHYKPSTALISPSSLAFNTIPLNFNNKLQRHHQASSLAASSNSLSPPPLAPVTSPLAVQSSSPLAPAPAQQQNRRHYHQQQLQQPLSQQQLQLQPPQKTHHSHHYHHQQQQHNLHQPSQPQAQHQQQHPQKANNGSSSSSSSSSALLPELSRNASSSIGRGILSRFSLLQSNNNQQQQQKRREDVCGRTMQQPERRIIGGEGARYGEFPYQVHIKIAKHQCGGALIDKQSIVTAAHCVYHFMTRAPVSKLQIVIGAYDIEDEQYQELPPQYFKVNRVKLHPQFRFSASHPDRYDIAILKLDKPVKYTDNVLPVCLPSKDLKFESMIGTVTGFGKTDPSLSNRYGTRLLQKVDVPIIENNECERWHRTRGIDLKIFPEMMCAGYEDGLKDACVGDSGGPLVVKTSSGPNGSFRWTLAGITSAGFGCAQSRQPGIYHRVSHTVDWILENLD